MRRQCLGGRRIGDLETLRAEISACLVNWRVKSGGARCKLKRV